MGIPLTVVTSLYVVVSLFVQDSIQSTADIEFGGEWE
jgi:hypothetical protein